MGMQLDDREQKLFYKLLVEELKSYGFDQYGEQVTPIRAKDETYVRLLLSTLKRIIASVKREHKRKERMANRLERIANDKNTLQWNSEDKE